MIFQNRNTIPKARISHPNIPPESHNELQMVVGENQMLALWTFSKGAEVSAHRHPEEQVSYIRRGRFRFRVEGDEEREVGEGDVILFRYNVEHALQSLEEGSQDLQIFSPGRESSPVQRRLHPGLIWHNRGICLYFPAPVESS
ncbi:MAG: cupin domain-containing protein [Nitrospinota bacterium]|nr:cupin domain-containing protein [Nitrospinota bacterium]MDP7169520.1 cupin domain-containing protein [Nitrospinota bacterium]MDP7369248.1 cupin domain-containing protein [Nitrospinota bacterium]MDP7502867.1 cupin domain-containing protein [Nitrospinota bacterium]MDP7664154.1 cupin domain-containing protein [Nitrospinota bacterium]